MSEGPSWEALDPESELYEVRICLEWALGVAFELGLTAWPKRIQCALDHLPSLEAK